MSFSSRAVAAEGETLQFLNCYWNGEKQLSLPTLDVEEAAEDCKRRVVDLRDEFFFPIRGIRMKNVFRL